MNRLSVLLVVTIAAFVAGIGVGCTVGFDVEQSDVFPCENDDDCVSGFECGPNDLCRSVINTPDGDCVDMDGDGYGVGEPDDLQQCPACTEARPNGCIQSDCDDDAANVNPGASEVCDGDDNDCDEETDEPAECTNDGDCPTEGAEYSPKCNNDTCEYFGPIQLGQECTVPLQCTGGAREPVPPACQ